VELENLLDSRQNRGESFGPANHVPHSPSPPALRKLRLLSPATAAGTSLTRRLTATGCCLPVRRAVNRRLLEDPTFAF